MLAIPSLREKGQLNLARTSPTRHSALAQTANAWCCPTGNKSP